MAPSVLLALHRMTDWILAGWHVHLLQWGEQLRQNNLGVTLMSLAHTDGVISLFASLLAELSSWLILCVNKGFAFFNNVPLLLSPKEMVIQSKEQVFEAVFSRPRCSKT